MPDEFPKASLVNIIDRSDLSMDAKTAAVIHFLLDNAQTKEAATLALYSEFNQQLSGEICALSERDSGLHFNAAGAMSEEKLTNFEIGDLAEQMQRQAPTVWTTLDTLFSANSRLSKQRRQARNRAHQKGLARKTKVSRANEGDIDMSDVLGPEDHESNAGSASLEDPSETAADDAPKPSDSEERYAKQLLIRKVVAISMMLVSTNQQCNALQSVIGIFLHSCNCPETLIEFLSRLGLSVSCSTINTGVKKLSAEAEAAIRALVQTLIVLLGYDNVDLELKHSVPTVNTPGSTSVHLTSGTYIPLRNATLDDLNCAEQLWETSLNNPANADKTSSPKAEAPQVPLEDILGIFSETDKRDSNGLVQTDRFNEWKFLHDLAHHGPEWFRQFRAQVGDPEEINCLPVEKTTQVPCRLLNVHPATTGANAEAIEKFLQQGGVGDPITPDGRQTGLKGLGNHVMLFFGDLLTGDRIRGLLQSRAPEDSSYRRLNHVVYVMGLFHLKMAAADAMWRIFIRPDKNKKSETDENSLLSHVGQLRPKETEKINSNPGFRRMHEVIQHTGIVSRLDCWRLESGCDTLDDFAAKKPSWAQLKEMASELRKKYVVRSTKVSLDRNDADLERDEQFENTLLRHHYFLLYEQLSYSMNHGDIGRLERCMIPWMFIFQGCGKHKYASELRRYLENMYFIYPEGLRKVIRSNILANPTGKKDAFRAIDWIVEHNNLYTKRIYGGKFSNHDVAHMIAESPLIELYKNIRRQFERMFCLENNTTRHSPPDMKATFQKLAIYMKENKANEEIKTRKTTMPVHNSAGAGINTLLMPDDVRPMTRSAAPGTTAPDADSDDEGSEDGDNEGGGDEGSVRSEDELADEMPGITGYTDADDVMVEIEDDGSLDDDEGDY